MHITKLNDKELYQYCSDLGKKALIYRSKFAGALPEVYKRKLYKKYRIASIYEFAAKLAGISKETVDKVIILERKLRLFPKFHEMLCTGQVGWAKLAVVAPMLNHSNSELMADKVLTMSKSALEALRRDFNEEQVGTIYTSLEFKKLTMTLSPQNFQKLKVFKSRSKALTWNEAIEKLLDLQNNNHRPAKTSSPPKKTTRYIPVEKRTEIEHKYHGLCAHPNCNKPGEILHHTIPFALNKNHNSLVPLCTDHHEIAHNSLYKNEKDFRLTFQPDTTTARYIIDQKYQKWWVGRDSNPRPAA